MGIGIRGQVENDILPKFDRALENGRAALERATRSRMGQFDTDLLRIADLRKAADLVLKPCFVLIARAAICFPATTLLSRSSNVVKLLASPPQLRANGFNLPSSMTPALYKGQARRIVKVGHAGLELWADGTLIAALGSQWIFQLRGEGQRINIKGLTESTYLFADLYTPLLQASAHRASGIEYGAHLWDIPSNTEAMSTKGLQVKLDQEEYSVTHVPLLGEGPARNAGEIMARLHASWGIEPDDMRYCNSENSAWAVDVNWLVGESGL